MRILLRTLFITLVFSCISIPLLASSQNTFYIAPNGNDSWSGRISAPNTSRSDGPFASLEGARDAVRKLKQNGDLTSPVRIIIKNGSYQMNHTLTLTPEDSGTKTYPISYEAAKGARPVFSGGKVIKGWKQISPGLWTAQIPSGWEFSQLFINGRRATRARTPNKGYYKVVGFLPTTIPGSKEFGPSTIIFNKGDIKQWSNLDDVNVVFWHLWETSRLRIASLDTEKCTVNFVSNARLDWFLNYLANPNYYVENFFEALDAPGEWYLNNKTEAVYYKPLPGEDINKVKVIAPSIPRLIQFAGDPAKSQYVENIKFRGLAFEYSDWKLEPEGHGDGQAAVTVEATVQGDGVRNCLISKCRIAHVGTYGIWLRNGCTDNRIEYTEVADTGAGGIRIGNQGIVKNDPEKTARNTIYSCYIHDGGKVYPGAIGVWIGQSPGNTISHNEIANHHYTGISIGWTWGYFESDTAGTITEYNHIHHLGQGLLNDMGAIYNLGASPGSRIANNHIHDVSGGGIYPDEGSAQLLIENNVAYRTLNGGFSLHYGKDNTVRNNIFAMSELHQVMRYRNEPFRAFSFENNIVYYDHGNVMGSGTLGQYDEFNKNLYWNTSKKPVIFPGDLTFKQWQALGRDVDSIIADPLFVNPAKDNYTLKSKSPAFKLGIIPIDVSKSGLVGDKDWVALPKRSKLKPMSLKQPKSTGGITSVNDDFESGPTGARALNAVTLGETSVALIRTTDESSADGKHSLKFIDAPGLDFYFNPHMFYSISFSNCIVRVSYDLRMEPGAIFWHEWRDNSLPYNAGPSIGIETDQLSVSDQKLFTIEPSKWMHIEITCGLGNKSTGKYKVDITMPDGRIKHYPDLPVNKKFERLDWVGFVSTAKDKAVFYMDNIKIEKVSK